MILLLIGLGCGPKLAPPDTMPGPLAEHDFRIPEIHEGRLANGMRVLVVEDHEVPMVWGSVAFRASTALDPQGKEGTGRLAMGMLTEGAGPWTSQTLSAELRRLGADLGASAGSDGSSLSFRTLSRNLPALADLVGQVLREPTLPDAEWAVRKQQALDGLARSRSDPDEVAWRVLARVLWGNDYRGRLETPSSLESLTQADARAWLAALDPADALLLVGGDTTLDAVVPLFDARLGSWTPPRTGHGSGSGQSTSNATIHLVDMPGRAQSVVRCGGFTLSPKEPDWYSMLLANQVWGGAFTARLNMNLREEKGWTYGARSSMSFNLRRSTWGAGGGIQTPHTGEAVGEILRELKESRAGRPFTSEELEQQRGALIGGYALRFEDPTNLLGSMESIWRYGLPANWVEGYVPGIRAVDLAGAQRAWASHLDPAAIQIVVVGDAAVVRPDLEKLGLPIVVRDADGGQIGG